MHLVQGGWKAYDRGNCDGLSYCRVTDPPGSVLFGVPDGDANIDGTTNSLDALLILQHGAGLVADVPCYFCGNVHSATSLDARDALAILQYEARLIPGLPLLRQWE